MKLLRFFLVFAAAVLLAGGLEAKELFTPGYDNKKVLGDSLFAYTETPWKCVFVNETSGDTTVRYYRRDGVEKARVSGSFFAALKQGPDNRDYYETWRTYESGETKLVRNWYNYGIDYGRKKDHREYQYTPRYNDRKGNWVYAKDPWRDQAYSRQLFYYDGPEYDAAEDSVIDSRIAGLVQSVKEQENPLNPVNLLLNAFQIVVKLIYLFGLFVLFMMSFRRGAFYLWFDCRAARKITPRSNGLFCKTLLYGIIPVLLASGPIALYVFSGHSTAVLKPGLVYDTLAGTALALVYCVIFVLVRSRRVGARCARWELAYSICMFVCLWAGVIFAIYVVVIALLAMFFLYMFFGDSGRSASDDDGPENMYATAWDGEGQYLTHISGEHYMDTSGNMYSTHGGLHRLGDLKPFS